MLPQVRRAALERLPNWTWNAHSNAWAEQYRAVSEWLLHHARIYPKQCSSALRERGLAKWVYKQHCAHNAEELGLERAKLLEQLPFWSWNPLRRRWDSWCALLESWFFDYPFSKETPRKTYPKSTRACVTEMQADLDFHDSSDGLLEAALAD